MATDTIGVIGYGNMGSAIVKGLVASQQFSPSDIHIADTDEAKLAEAEKAGHFTHTGPEFMVDLVDIILIAVKPKDAGVILASCKGIAREKLIISVMAGVTIQTMEESLPYNPIIRVMPNTPCLVGAGANVLAKNKSAKPNDVELAKKILAAVGFVSEVDESLMDAVTGLSGSGPAYVAIMIDALSDGGVKMGLPRPLAMKLAAQTVYGTARMMLEKGIHPAKLRDMVASPAGTTIEGIAALEANGFRAALIDAVESAALRSEEMG